MKDHLNSLRQSSDRDNISNHVTIKSREWKFATTWLSNYSFKSIYKSFTEMTDEHQTAGSDLQVAL